MVHHTPSSIKGRLLAKPSCLIPAKPSENTSCKPDLTAQVLSELVAASITVPLLRSKRLLLGFETHQSGDLGGVSRDPWDLLVRFRHFMVLGKSGGTDLYA